MSAAPFAKGGEPHEILIGERKSRRGRPMRLDQQPSLENLKRYYEDGIAPSSKVSAHQAVRRYESILAPAGAPLSPAGVPLSPSGVPIYPITPYSLLEFIAMFAPARSGGTVRTVVLQLSYIAGLSGWGHPAHDCDGAPNAR